MSCVLLQKRLAVFNKPECFAISTAASEKGKIFRFENHQGKTICRVRVDGCLIAEHDTKKCDFLFYVREDDRYYLVELKGSDVDTAVEQVIRTFKIIKPYIKAAPSQYIGIIVSSSVPAATQASFRKLQERCLRDNKFILKKTHQLHMERL